MRLDCVQFCFSFKLRNENAENTDLTEYYIIFFWSLLCVRNAFEQNCVLLIGKTEKIVVFLLKKFWLIFEVAESVMIAGHGINWPLFVRERERETGCLWLRLGTEEVFETLETQCGVSCVFFKSLDFVFNYKPIKC